MSKLAYSTPQKMRALLAPLLVLTLLLAAYGLVSLRLAAWVGGKAITRAELNTRMQIVQFIYDRQFGQDPSHDPKFAQKYQRDVLEQLAEESLLLPEAEGLATAEELEEYAKSYLDWIKVGYFANDPEQLNQALAALQITEADLLQYFSNNLLLTRLREQAVQSVTVDEPEVKAYYEQNKAEFDSPEMVKVSHILVDSEDKAQQLLQELSAGADFAALALKHSLDAETAAIGGSLRWFERGEMQPAFEEAAFALEPGEVSEIVKTTEGWHIIKMEGKQEAKAKEYAEVASLAQPLALEAKKDAAWAEYRRTLRGKQLMLLFVR